MTKPNILILHASGTNRDYEAVWACELAGGAPEVVHINQLRRREKKLADYQMMVVAGGFSYGDALAAGRRLALDLTLDIADDLAEFVATGKPILGICNGFQALVKAGLLPNPTLDSAEQSVTLTHNQRQLFECRWVTLLPNPDSPCIFTRNLTGTHLLPGGPRRRSLCHGYQSACAVCGLALQRQQLSGQSQWLGR